LLALSAVALTGGIVTGIELTSQPAAGTMRASSFECSASGSHGAARVTVTSARGNDPAGAYDLIQGAIDTVARRGGGIVSLSSGTFVVNNHLVLRGNVELAGVGPRTVIKAGPDFLARQGPGGGYPILTTDGASDVTIADLTADQSGSSLDGNVAARLAGYLIEDRDSHNVVIDHVYTRNPFTYSIAVVGSTDFCVENSNVQVGAEASRYSQLDGIHILDSHSGQVINNVVVSGDDGLAAHTIGASVHDVLYADNDVQGGRDTDGMQLAVGNYPIYNIRIEHNDFHGSSFGIRTGYYDARTGGVYSISITGNYIHDLVLGRRSPAVKIGGFSGRGPISDVTIADNRICKAGAVTVQRGAGNVVAGTTHC
jgi:polygalacturonase